MELEMQSFVYRLIEESLDRLLEHSNQNQRKVVIGDEKKATREGTKFVKKKKVLKKSKSISSLVPLSMMLPSLPTRSVRLEGIRKERCEVTLPSAKALAVVGREAFLPATHGNPIHSSPPLCWKFQSLPSRPIRTNKSSVKCEHSVTSKTKMSVKGREVKFEEASKEQKQDVQKKAQADVPTHDSTEIESPPLNMKLPIFRPTFDLIQYQKKMGNLIPRYSIPELSFLYKNLSKQL